MTKNSPTRYAMFLGLVVLVTISKAQAQTCKENWGSCDAGCESRCRSRDPVAQTDCINSVCVCTIGCGHHCQETWSTANCDPGKCNDECVAKHGLDNGSNGYCVIDETSSNCICAYNCP